MHHRAPLMFHEESYTDWMTLPADDAQAMMTPYAGEVEFFEIGRAIGNVGNNSPELLKPSAQVGRRRPRFSECGTPAALSGQAALELPRHGHQDLFAVAFTRSIVARTPNAHSNPLRIATFSAGGVVGESAQSRCGGQGSDRSDLQRLA